jgi:hypothetical protein
MLSASPIKVANSGSIFLPVSNVIGATLPRVGSTYDAEDMPTFGLLSGIGAD